MQAISHWGPEAQAGLERPAPVIVLEALSRFVSPETIRSVLPQTGCHSRRIWRLPATIVVWLAIGIWIWTDWTSSPFGDKSSAPCHPLFLAQNAKHPPRKSAFSQAHTRLGPFTMRHPAGRLACVRRRLRTDQAGQVLLLRTAMLLCLPLGGIPL